MKTLPNEKTLLTLLDELKNAEQQAREICEMSTKTALKYQQKMQKIKQEDSKSDRLLNR
ncbi:MAG: hypothetical protein AB4041_05170 [Microcystaceae cyanobacterium]